MAVDIELYKKQSPKTNRPEGASIGEIIELEEQHVYKLLLELGEDYIPDWDILPLSFHIKWVKALDSLYDRSVGRHEYDQFKKHAELLGGMIESWYEVWSEL